MVGAISKATKSSFQKGMTFCCSIYVKKVMELPCSYLNSPRILIKYNCFSLLYHLTCTKQLKRSCTVINKMLCPCQ